MEYKSCDMEMFFKFKKAGFTNDEAFKLARKTEKNGIKSEDIKLMTIGGLLPAIQLMQVDRTRLPDIVPINLRVITEMCIIILISYTLIKMVIDTFTIEDRELLKMEIFTSLIKCFLGVICIVITPYILSLLTDLAARYHGIPIKRL